ncbi:hypothetical protein WMF27_30420 [Sorangium sp. So ce281]|uniref:hypothetical protein n=1 Tax=unclassified Sorangium TaxID=2621164 RepID=UPI003F602FEE
MTAPHSRPCGCAGVAAEERYPWSRRACGCGCEGCSRCARLDAACASGTEEATRRPGPPAAPCLPPRPRFFPGQLVTDADLRAIVDHARRAQRLAAAAAGGWGVYGGYALSPDAEACAVRIGPGVAFDARGRALVHGGTARLARPERALVGDARRASGAEPAHGGDVRRTPGAEPASSSDDETFVLAAVYDDHLAALQPRYGGGCGPGVEPGGDYARVEERVRFVWLARLPDDYWVSGCLHDPCAEAPEAPAREARASEGPNDPCGAAPSRRREPRLDVCTPPNGVRGGAGAQTYADWLARRWNLPRNAAALAGIGAAAEHGPPDAGVGAILDVIAGMAFPQARGEAIVALGEVRFARADGRSIVEVRPLRRPVLSNADLTYLVAWMLERLLRGAPGDVRAELEPAPPAASAPCAAPEVGRDESRGSAPRTDDEVDALRRRVRHLEAELRSRGGC